MQIIGSILRLPYFYWRVY